MSSINSFCSSYIAQSWVAKPKTELSPSWNYKTRKASVISCMFKSDIYPEHESSRKDRRKAFFCKIIQFELTLSQWMGTMCPGCPTSSVVFFCFIQWFEVRGDGWVFSVDIGEIVDHQYLNFLFIITLDRWRFM